MDMQKAKCFILDTLVALQTNNDTYCICRYWSYSMRCILFSGTRAQWRLATSIRAQPSKGITPTLVTKVCYSWRTMNTRDLRFHEVIEHHGFMHWMFNKTEQYFEMQAAAEEGQTAKARSSLQWLWTNWSSISKTYCRKRNNQYLYDSVSMALHKAC